MSNLETIVGRMAHVGQSSWDENVHTYSLLEIETLAERVDLKDTMASNDLARAISPGNDLAMAILRAAPGGKAKNIVIGVFDKGSQRLFVNEEMYKLRDEVTKQAILLSMLAIVAIPVGLAFFVVPGLLYVNALWKAWSSINWFPTSDEIRATVERLPGLVAAPKEVAPKGPMHPE